MKVYILVLSIVCTLQSRVDAVGKLQIVVENNVDDCEYRAQNGDLLYTLSNTIPFVLSEISCEVRIKNHKNSKIISKGTFEDGTVFDSNVGSSTPYTFKLGARHVIKGMDQGTLGMCVGEIRRLVIPSELAYGEDGAGDVIPPDSTLIFETELVKIVRKDEL